MAPIAGEGFEEAGGEVGGRGDGEGGGEGVELVGERWEARGVGGLFAGAEGGKRGPPCRFLFLFVQIPDIAPSLYILAY